MKAADKWLCYMCSPDHSKVGLLSKREDWVHKLKELFMNDHEMEYVSDRTRCKGVLQLEIAFLTHILTQWKGVKTRVFIVWSLG